MGIVVPFLRLAQRRADKHHPLIAGIQNLIRRFPCRPPLIDSHKRNLIRNLVSNDDERCVQTLQKLIKMFSFIYRGKNQAIHVVIHQLSD